MKRLYPGIVIFIAFALLLAAPTTAFAQISLGTSASFSVLGGSGVTNTGASVVTGNVGVSPGSSITGFPPGVVVGGTIHAADGTAGSAHTDMGAAYDALASPTTVCNVDLTGQNLGGLVLTPGVYCFSSSAFLTGTLTLNMQGDPNALFIFKIGSTLTTAGGSSVILTNTTSACPPNIFWQVGSSATLGTTSSFIGNILALTSITLTTGADLNGRALARNGAVTLDTNTIALCAPAIICPIIVVNPATLPNGNVGVVYNAAVSGGGGVGPYTFAVTSGALPNGLLLNGGTGAITGTPTTIGTFNFTITATDTSSGCLGSRPYVVIIAAASCPVITMSPATLPPGAVGLAYDQTISAVGGLSPYSFSITSGALPNGLTINANTGQITGLPTTPGLFSFTVRATDGNLCAGSRPYSILILAGTVAGIPSLGFPGMAMLIALLGAAAVFAIGRFR